MRTVYLASSLVVILVVVAMWGTRHQYLPVGSVDYYIVNRWTGVVEIQSYDEDRRTVYDPRRGIGVERPKVARVPAPNEAVEAAAPAPVARW